MNIGIITPLTTDKKAGIGVYVSKLIEYLQKIDQVNNYYVFTFPGNRHMFEIKNHNFEEIVVGLGSEIKNRNLFRVKYFFWQKYMLPVYSQKYNLDLIHIPSTWFVHEDLRLPSQVITIHDLAEFHTTRYSNLLSRIKRKMVNKSIRNSNAILTVSNFSKKEIINLGCENVYSVHNGYEINDAKVQDDAKKKYLDKFNLVEKKYFIFIGTKQKHKNIPKIIQSFKTFFEVKQDYKLVLAGKEDNAKSQIRKAILESNLEKQIVLLDYITEEAKRILVANSLALLLISNYEGFGLPILEAQELETAIICSNRSSLPEVAGSGALRVSNDINEIINSMEVLSSDEELRKNLIKKGKNNLKRFSWGRTAEKTLNVYKMVYKNSHID